jgi:hypothetical protein
LSTLTVGKLDAARRQLDTAIRLYFVYGDPVSIHALASAAYQLLDDLIAVRGGPTGFKDLFLKIVRPDRIDEARKKLNEAQNFFKHADRDHDGVLDFRPEATELILLDACERYFALTGESLPSLRVFRAWFMVGGAGVNLVMPEEQEKSRKAARRAFPNPQRDAFFREVLPMVAELQGGFGDVR